VGGHFRVKVLSSALVIGLLGCGIGMRGSTAGPAVPGYSCFGALGVGGNGNQSGGLGGFFDRKNPFGGFDIGTLIPEAAKFVSLRDVGTQPTMYPEDTGILVKKGTKVVMEVHYNIGSVAPDRRSDQSNVESAMADKVAKRGSLIHGPIQTGPTTNP
jgi:hypothetical protein